jgi:putative hydrolase
MNIREDNHVHSSFSDDATGSVDEVIAAARERGLRTICLTDHVRADTPWVGEYVDTVRRAATRADLEVLCGVEVKLLDHSGRLDLPPELPALDRVLIADHQFPGPDGPTAPGAVKARLDVGMMTDDEVIDALLAATANAVRRTPDAQLAHPFSVLPKLGLDESMIGADRLGSLAATLGEHGAVVEVNEKWGCPGPEAIAAFRAAGVPLVAGTDSHRPQDVGRYDRVPALLAT